MRENERFDTAQAVGPEIGGERLMVSTRIDDHDAVVRQFENSGITLAHIEKGYENALPVVRDAPDSGCNEQADQQCDTR